MSHVPSPKGDGDRDSGREMSDAEALHLAVGALVEELVRSGVHHFCVCPGSRSTPLALTLARYPQARVWMHLDERSAGFFGLGLARTLRGPVALVCTSGTAAANFMPAVVEAFYSRVPLVVLTADRPHELRDCGAPQTIDQVGLFGPHVRWFVDLPEPQATPDLVRYVRTVACRAVATARNDPAGPVHLNCPYRDPLVPVAGARAEDLEGRPDGQPYAAVVQGRRTPPARLVADLAASLSSSFRGLMVCGPLDDPDLASPLVELAAALGYPILADPLSGLRRGEHDRELVLDAYDAFLRDADFVERFSPQVVLRFGASPTSKPLLLYLERHAACRQILVDGGGGWNDPTRLIAQVVHGDGPLLCEQLLVELPSEARRTDWLRAWLAADRLARQAMADRLASMDELFEGKVFAELAELMPAGSLLYAGNSMPARDLDTFFPKDLRAVRLMGSRGASGIDGVISSALGVAAAGARPLVLAIGDISFYHDSNGLLAARRFGLDATIVLLHNDGGGIFSFLPQATEAEHFETLFGTPHGLDFRPLAEMYGASFTRVGRWEEFRAAVKRGIDGGGLAIVEVPTERRRNVELHREIWLAVSRALCHPSGVDVWTYGSAEEEAICDSTLHTSTPPHFHTSP